MIAAMRSYQSRAPPARPLPESDQSPAYHRTRLLSAAFAGAAPLPRQRQGARFAEAAAPWCRVSGPMDGQNDELDGGVDGVGMGFTDRELQDTLLHVEEALRLGAPDGCTVARACACTAPGTSAACPAVLRAAAS